MKFSALKKEIKNLRIQGAKEIAIACLEFFRYYCNKHGFDKKFEKYAEELENLRPTAVVLHNCLEILRREKTLETIEELLEMLKNSGEKIAKHGSKLIQKRATAMTYCHSSEALAVIKRAWNEGKIEKVYVAETRPKMQGVKTSKELAKYGIETVLITDNARGVFIKECDLVIVGSDAMREEGNVNKIGTFTLGVLAKEFKKPFYVVGNTLKIDYRKKFVIEERPKAEVLRTRLKNLEVRNPAFDVTPWKYITKIITEKGIFTSKKILDLISNPKFIYYEL